MLFCVIKGDGERKRVEKRHTDAANKRNEIETLHREIKRNKKKCWSRKLDQKICLV